MKQLDYRMPKTKTGMKTFDKIVETGKVLFAEKGFLATSVNDVIEHSGVAAGTFYIYFDNKLALYMYLLNEYRTNIRKAASEATHGLKTREEMEREGLKAFIKFVWNDPLAYKLIWESLFVDQEIFKEYYQSFSDSYVYHLGKAVQSGEVRSDLDLETASYVLMGISNFVGLQILFKNQLKPGELDFIVDEAMKIIQAGIFNKSK